MMSLEPETGDRLRPVAEINVTPFIDVVLVLLVIFMVAAPLALAEVPLKLPRSEAQPAAAPAAPVVVSLTVDGRLFLDEKETDPAALGKDIKSLLAADPERVIQVRADESLPYSRVVELLGKLGALGATRLSLMTEKSPPTP
jgi:biopolymer transport protein ExbD/biopolymer transport protein TolR